MGQSMIIQVAWNRQLFEIDLGSSSDVLSRTTVADLKSRIKEATGMPINSMKLIYSGAVMKNDLVPLSQYGIRNRSKVMLLTSMPDGGVANRQAQDEDSEEQALLIRVQNLVAQVTRTLIPQIESYEQQVAGYFAAPPLPPDADAASRQRFEKTHREISERLMQALFALDSIVCPENAQRVREKRREAVRWAQSLLDRVDRCKEQLAQGLRARNN
ncbi:uncharacterized protein VTP21DRAFT_1151 [Calcarisporiella thermophila]|uniref:uncharacterized protein n=1 Tax=Calcarisporiella thermophila TaxID=911321 RepID=UPI0037433C24